jgi:hypothetical protein
MLKRQIRHRSEFKAKSGDPNVRLIKPAPRQSVTTVERFVVNRLKYMRGNFFKFVLVEAVVRDLYVQELANGASALDFGAFGPTLFSTALLEKLELAMAYRGSFETSL